MKIGGLEKSSLLDYPGKISAIVYTIGCNFRCPYCHNPELVNETIESEIKQISVLNFLKSRRGLLDGVVITGGEPTIQEDLLDFMQEIKSMGFSIKLDTNGTRPEIIQAALKKNLVDYIAMDIKAPLLKYSQTIARPVNTKVIKKSIQLIMRLAPDYEFRTTVIKSLISCQDIELIGNLIKGAKRYYLQRFEQNKILNPLFKQKTTYSNEELNRFQKILSSKVGYCGIR